MRKILIYFFMFMLAMSLVGCGKRKSLGDRAGEALAEKIIKEAGGGDVDIDGDVVVVKGEDGEEAIFGETDWPTSDLAANIPKFESGKVVTVMEMNDSLLVFLEEVPQNDFMDYFEEIKENYTEESYEMKSEDSVTYGGSKDGIGVSLIYSNEKTLSITVSKMSE